MKHLIVVASIMTSVSSMVAMEDFTTLDIRDRDDDSQIRPYITIINQLPMCEPDLNPYILNPQILISDQKDTRYYNSQSYYHLDDSTVMLRPHQGVRFSPNTYTTLPGLKRLGMNDEQDAARIQIYVQAAVTKPQMQLIIGKGAKIQFGDEIIFTQLKNNIVLTHKNNLKQENILAKLETERSIKNITQPDLFETKIVKTLSESWGLTASDFIQSSHDKNENKNESVYITIINQLPKNNCNFSHARIDISEKIKSTTYTNRSYSPEENLSVIINSDETHQFPLNIDETGNSSIILYIPDAVDNQLLQLDVGKDSKVKCGDTITVTPQSSDTIAIKYNELEKPLISLNTQQMVTLIGLLDYQEKINRYGKNDAEWYNDSPYVKNIAARFSITK
jgi:hypothetical protein